MSDDAKVGLVFLAIFATLITGMVVGVRHDNARMRQRCAKAFAGATASDSLRIITVQPQCRP
jgi:hypothetical protein